MLRDKQGQNAEAINRPKCPFGGNMLGGEMEVAGIKSVTTLHYLSLPVNLGYNYAISEKAGGVFLEAGPQIDYALSGNTKVSGLGDTEKTTDMEFGSEDHETSIRLGF